MTDYNSITAENPSGYWSFNSFSASNEYKLHKVLARGEVNTKWVRISKNEENWGRLSAFKNLEEIHLYSPSDAQIDLISRLEGIKRLSIFSYRPKTIDFLVRMTALEELSLDAVSGFDDLSPIQHLRNLRALNLDLLRRIKDFSALEFLNGLRFLRIVGTYDFDQPIRDLSFCRGLKNLEYLIIDQIRVLKKEHSASPLRHLESLKYIGMPRNAFPLEEYAFIEEALKGVDGAKHEAVEKYIWFFHGNVGWTQSVPWTIADDKVEHIDMKRSLTAGVQKDSGVVLATEHFTDIGLPSVKTGHLDLLGRGSRGFQSTVKNVEKRCLAHIEKYNVAKQDARNRIAHMNGG